MSQTEPAATRPKATWFCPTCSHESSVWGDWAVETHGDVERTTCPECGTTIDERPVDEDAYRSPSWTDAGSLTKRVLTAVGLVYASLSMQVRWLHRA